MSNKDDKDNPMVQSRSENSVLFSLDALSSNASSEKNAKDAGQAQEDSSGFINLNAIASSSQYVSENQGAGAAGAPAPMMAPAMIPMGSEKKSNTLPLIVVGVLSVVLVLVIGILAYVLTQPKEVKEVPGTTAAAAATAPNTNAGTQEKPKEKAAAPADNSKEKADSDDEIEKLEEEISEKEMAEAKGDPEKEKALAERKARIEAARKEHEEKMRTDPKYRKEYLEKVERRKARLAEKKKEDAARKAALEKSGQQEAPSKPAGKRKTDGIPTNVDNILNDITPGKGKTTTAKTETPKETPSGGGEGLSRSAIKGTVGRYMGRIRSCGGGDKSGTVMVRFSIQPNGSVGGAAVTNGKNGTPEGNCVLAVVRSMGFPSFSGSAKTVNFPFRLP